MSATAIDDQSYARAEYERIVLSNDVIQTQLAGGARMILPDRENAIPIIISEIMNHLGAGLPMSLIRVSDGEGNALRLNHDLVLPIHWRTFNSRLIGQNGWPIDEDRAKWLCQRIREAILGADIVGFRSFDPTVNGPEPELIQRHIASNNMQGGLGILYAREFFQDAIRDGLLKDKILTTAWIYLALIKRIDDLLESAPSVVIITGRSELEAKFAKRLGHRLKRFIAVPVQGFRPRSLGESHFGSTAGAILDYLRTTELRSVLVLVGAGFLGKLYCAAARQSGGVAVDLGSGFDLLAGLSTRPAHAKFNLQTWQWA